MRISTIVILVFFVFTAGYGQQSEVREIGTFQGVKASEGIDVYLKKGDKESIKVEATGVQLSDVITEVNGTMLRIRFGSGNHSGKISVKVSVTYSALNKLAASSGANVFSDAPIKSSRMEISTASSGSVETKLESEFVKVTSASGGKAELEGKTKALEIEVASGGDVDAYNLESETVKVSSSSGGEAKVNVTKQLDAHANSGGDIRYRGNPTKTNTASNSGGSVKKTN